MASRWARHLGMGLPIAGVIALSAGVLFAQAVEPARRIAAVEVNGLQRVSRDRVLETIRLRSGDTYSTQAVDEDVRRLNAMGCFNPTGISVRREPLGDGIKLIFDLKERPIISGVRFVGNRAFTETQLLEAVGLKEGAFLDVAGQRESTAKIADLYREKRYQFAGVDREDKLDAGNNTASVTFTIQEGPQVTLKEIRFEGNQAFASAKLLDQMETRTRKFWFITQAFDDAVFQTDLVKLRQFYKRFGWLDAVVTGDYQYSSDKSQLSVVVKITEGVQYRVGEVTVTGAVVTTPEELMKGFKLKAGAIFGADDYQHDLLSIENFYSSKGRIDVRVEPRETFPEPGVINIAYTITENKEVRLGMLDIRGNLKTKDKVIRREFDIYPGDLFDTAKIDKAVERLRSMKYFKDVQSTVTPGEAPDERNLVVEVEEGRTGQFMFGGGVSSNNGVIGQLQLSLENFDIADCPKSFGDLINGNAFVGAGQRLLVQLSPGTELSQARLFFADPYLFDSKFSFSTDFYLIERERETYNEGRLGARVTLGRRFTERFSGRLTFRAEQVDISGIDDTAPRDVTEVKGKTSITSLGFGLDYDRTDSRMDPSRGYKLGGSLEVATGDWHFVKGIIDATLYHTLFETKDNRKHILAFHGTAGVVKTYSGDPFVPIFERFYAGGRGSVRGFAYRGLGPREGDTPLGGEFSAVGSVEYLFPLYQTTYKGRSYEMIRGVLFCDIGQVAYKLSDMGGNKWRVGAGAGVRLSIPALGGIPIAIDLGFPVVKDSNDQTEIFSFSVGAEF